MNKKRKTGSTKPGPENSKWKLYIEKEQLPKDASHYAKMANREHRYSFPSRDHLGEAAQFDYMKTNILEAIHKNKFYKAVFEEVATGRVIHLFINGQMKY